MEITSEEQNKVKRMKRTEDSQRLLEQYQTHWHSNYRDPRSRVKQSVWENFWRDYSWKFPLHGKGNSQVQEVQSPIQDKPKEKHAKTHTNQINKD